MADLQHSTLQNAKVHEPKHITNATTVDTGQVITPSSTTNGESELRNLTPAEVGSPLYLFQYGIEENTISTEVTAGTLYDPADYKIVDNADIQMSEQFNTGGYTFNAANNSVTVLNSGWYFGGSWTTVKADSTNTLVGFTYAIDGVVITTGGLKTVTVTTGGTNSSASVSGYGYAPLTAGQEIQLALYSDSTVDYVIADHQFSLRFVGAL